MTRVGAGAFMLEEWRRGEALRLKKNPNYWEADRVKLDGVEWQFIPKWSLIGTRGDRGTSILDVLFQHRY